MMITEANKGGGASILHLPREFTPQTAFIGGLLIASASILFLLFANKRTGISGLFGQGMLSLLQLRPLDNAATCFMGSFLLASVIAGRILQPTSSLPFGAAALSSTAYILGGLAIGFGTRLGDGCTSGHGVCGLSRLSKRGLVAVCTFMLTGIITASLCGTYRLFLEAPSSSFSKYNQPLTTWSTVGEKWSLGIVAISVLLLIYHLPSKIKQTPLVHLSAIISGALFAFGLVVSGMAQQAKVLNFLWPRYPGWDPSLMVVLGAAVGVGLPITQYILNNVKTALGDPSAKIYQGKTALQISATESIDGRLLAGAAIFGIGWGLTGLCPGPALISFAFGQPKVVFYFFPCYILGYLAVELLVNCAGKKVYSKEI